VYIFHNYSPWGAGGMIFNELGIKNQKMGYQKASLFILALWTTLKIFWKKMIF